MLIAGMLMFNSQMFGQRTCGAHDVMLHQMKENPRFAQKQQEIETHTMRIQQTPMLKATGTITIPVHVIVVYANSAQNISDAQIQSQIDVLNLDYRRLNTDWTSTPSEFYNLVADSEIEFTLQAVERHADSKTSWGTNDAVKSSYPPYSPNTHLNMWVCNIGGGILGYAQFPGGSSATDGVVISPQYFGSIDYNDGSFNLDAPFNKGRTATHEVGHWLNLRHIWGDGGCGATDYVEDTPDSDGANYGCPTHPSAACGTNDMFMNYMDYVDDACMYMFSEGQKTRMRAVFEPGGPRESFVNGGSITCDVNACDGNVSLNLTTDNYGSETSWTLTDEAGTTIDQGSSYSNGQTITKNWNLAEGKYTFTIYDSYGDGICCSYGNGSYSLTDGCSTTLKSGGNFGSSEATTFCVPGGSSNTPPVAVANGPYTGTEGTPVNFSSTGSNDPDGTISSYLWDFGDGTTSGSQNPSHTYATAGTYNITLTVTDNGGATGSDATTATIEPAGGTNIPPVAVANGPYTGTEGVAVSFSSSGSNDPDGSISSYLWNFGDGTTSASQNPSHTYVSAGTYNVSLTVTDNEGATNSNATTATITPAGGSTVELSFDDFENGWGAWSDGGSDCSRYTSGSYAYSGMAAINIQDNSGVSSSFYHTNYYDVHTAGYTQISVEFVFYARSMENGEDFWVQYYNGSSWSTVASFASGSDFNNTTFYSATVNIDEANYNFPTNMKIRFMCDASGNADDVYIDDVKVTASTGTARSIGTKSIRTLSTLRTGAIEEDVEDLNVYPNPVDNELTISVAVEDNSVAQIYSVTGALVRTINLNQEVTTVNIGELSPGIYLVKVETGDEVMVKRIIKK